MDWEEETELDTDCDIELLTDELIDADIDCEELTELEIL
jgi:hypothetical protein